MSHRPPIASVTSRQAPCSAATASASRSGSNAGVAMAVATTARRPCRSNTGAAAASRDQRVADPRRRTHLAPERVEVDGRIGAIGRCRRASASIAARSPKAKKTRPVAERSRGMMDPMASEVITVGFPGNQRTTVAPALPHTARRQVRPVARATG